jgi:hypothetical protein
MSDRYDDTDMTEAEFDRRLAASIPEQVYSSRAESPADQHPLAHVVGATSNVIAVSVASPRSSWVIERFVGEQVFGWADLNDKMPPTVSGGHPLANVG